MRSWQDRPVRRFGQLATGLVVYGVGLALLVQARLGVDPWTVLAQGLSRLSGISLGQMTILISVGVLVLWVPLRQRPGVGTVANAVVVGLVLDWVLGWLPATESLPLRIAFLVGAILLVGLATGLYVGAGLGPGARDGLMTGLAARGVPIWAGRSLIELSVLLLGWLLGGSVGVGTVAYAVSIGTLVSRLLPRLTVRPREG